MLQGGTTPAPTPAPNVIKDCTGGKLYLDDNNILRRIDTTTGPGEQMDCGYQLNLANAGIAGLGVGVFADMPSLQIL